ncbi:MAG: hypothetical protein WCG28_03360 [bacterium]
MEVILVVVPVEVVVEVGNSFLKKPVAKNPKRIPPAFIPQTPFCGRNPNPNLAEFQKKISLGFAKSFSPESGFGKTESAFEFRQFLLWRNPTSPATTIQNQKRENPRQIKTECVVARRGRSDGAGTEPNTLRCSVEWTLRRDGIHYLTLF